MKLVFFFCLLLASQISAADKYAAAALALEVAKRDRITATNTPLTWREVWQESVKKDRPILIRIGGTTATAPEGWLVHDLPERDKRVKGLCLLLPEVGTGSLWETDQWEVDPGKEKLKAAEVAGRASMKSRAAK